MRPLLFIKRRRPEIIYCPAPFTLLHGYNNIRNYTPFVMGLSNYYNRHPIRRIVMLEGVPITPSSLSGRPTCPPHEASAGGSISEQGGKSCRLGANGIKGENLASLYFFLDGLSCPLASRLISLTGNSATAWLSSSTITVSLRGLLPITLAVPIGVNTRCPFLGIFFFISWYSSFS